MHYFCINQASALFEFSKKRHIFAVIISIKNTPNSTLMKLPSSANILLLGSGGRECAFAWKIAQSEGLGKLFIAPGNGATSKYGVNVDISPLDFSVVKHFVLTNYINLVVVGPEEPLVRGIKDFFKEDPEIRHIPVIGPAAEAAAMEGSKDFSKQFMARHSIPTARYLSVTADNLDKGYEFLSTLKAPYVLKADGLAAGKGVLILDSLAQATEELRAMIDGKFAAASRKVIIEEFLSGIEVSVFVATDGKSYKILPEAKDYKRIGEGDTGLNTGGMGAVSPVPFYDAEFANKVEQRIIRPTIDGIIKDKLDYTGFIFIGLMNCGGDPYVIEYNVRMGDPETEVVVPRIKSDIIDLFDGIAHGTLHEKEVVIEPRTAVTIMCVSGGYPDSFQKGYPISGLADVNPESTVFQAGTTTKASETLTAGGRVLTVTSLGDSISEAAMRSYESISKIHYTNIYFRKDIGQDLIKIAEGSN